jgi:hypothetical protein
MMCGMVMSEGRFALRVSAAMSAGLPERGFGESAARAATPASGGLVLRPCSSGRRPGGLSMFNRNPLVIPRGRIRAARPWAAAVCSGADIRRPTVQPVRHPPDASSAESSRAASVAPRASRSPRASRLPAAHAAYDRPRPCGRAEGLLQPDICGPYGHPAPNDVFAIGPVVPPAWNFASEGELFQSPATPGAVGVDVTNVDRISSSLGIGPGAPPPYHGPFSPNAGAPNPGPNPPLGPGALGLMPLDNVDALSATETAATPDLRRQPHGRGAAEPASATSRAQATPVVGTPHSEQRWSDPGTGGSDLFRPPF